MDPFFKYLQICSKHDDHLDKCRILILSKKLQDFQGTLNRCIYNANVKPDMSLSIFLNRSWSGFMTEKSSSLMQYEGVFFYIRIAI